MSRVQDFLNISISGHMTLLNLNEQHNLLYHWVVVCILFLSVVFCLALFLFTYFCSNSQQQQCCHSIPSNKGTLGRRMRRRLWNLSSPFSLFKSCFNTPFSPATSPPRYPLLYKSSHHMHCQSHNLPNTQLVSSLINRPSCPLVHCSSTNSFLMSKRNICGGIINRYMINSINNQQPTISGDLKNSPQKSEKSSSLSSSSRAHSNSITNKQTILATTTETTSLMDHTGAQIVSNSQSSCHSSCCMTCPDNGCRCGVVTVSCDTDDPNGCSKCAATGKCSTCCPYIRNNGDLLEQTNNYQTQSVNHSMKHFSSSTQSVLSESKSSTKSTNKESSTINELMMSDQSSETKITTGIHKFIDDE